MAQQPATVRVGEVEWGSLVPFTHLFRSFRLAVAPQRLGLALLMVVLLFIGGKLLDAIWGGRGTYPQEVQLYAASGSAQAFEQRLDALRESRALAVSNRVRVDPLTGIFTTALDYQLDAFNRLVTAATALRLGLWSVADGHHGLAASRDTVLGELYQMAVVIPGWLWAAHPWFLIVYLLIVLGVTSILGGALCRSIATEAGGHDAAPLGQCLRFAQRRVGSFIGAPVFVPLCVGLLALLFALCGWVLFNLPVFDILGGLIFGLFLVLAAIAAVSLILYAAGVHLMYPAIAVEGTDFFDAIARAFNYVFNRPWRWLLYTLVALVYGAVTYLFVGAVVFATVWLAHRALGWWVVVETGAANVNRFDAMVMPPELGRIQYDVQWEQLTWSGKAAAALIGVWVMLLLGVLPAYAISFYYAAHTLIYLLLRRSADGVDLSEVYEEQAVAPVTPPPAAPPPPTTDAAPSELPPPPPTSPPTPPVPSHPPATPTT